MATFAKATFSAASYATFRPSYPPALYNTILSYHNGSTNLCVDLGTGPGNMSRYLSKKFKHVIGTDPSDGMLKQARESTPAAEYPNVEFRKAAAEDAPFLADGSVDLVTAGQAAHWFDYPRLFPELQRIVRPGGTLAFFGYKDPVFPNYPRATKIVDSYAYGESNDTMGPYWQRPGRTITQNKLRDIKPPTTGWSDITRVEYEPSCDGPNTGEGTMFMQKMVKVGALRNYVRTWSSFHGWQEAHPSELRRDGGGPGDLADRLFDEIKAVEEEWRDDEKEILVEWGSGLLLAKRS